MKHTTRLLTIVYLMAVTAFFLTNLANSSESVLDTYTAEDNAMLNNYLQNDQEKNIEDVAIIDYIVHKIKDGKDSVEIYNGYFMIYKLTKQHRLYFEVILIEQIVNLMSSESLSYQYDQPEDYRKGLGNLIRAQYTLGIIRTDTSIEFLLQLMQPVGNWQESLKKGILHNPNQDALIQEIRIQSLGSLLQPKDEKGRELLKIIEDLVNNFHDDDIVKPQLLSRINGWKKIYKSGMDKFNFMN